MVPALVSEEIFERVAARIEENKRFAPRNTKTTPSLLQGLAACSACGYGYYRTSTRTTNRKIYYYRCLGSDDYRYENGRVCWNKPVRAYYLDETVWEHITKLISDPTLIRAEIDSRLRQARDSDPTKRERGQVELAFQEQLITLDELRARMPELRTREANLRGQLDALGSQIADRDLYLALATDLEGFLSQLSENAKSAEITERQRVLPGARLTAQTGSAPDPQLPLISLPADFHRPSWTVSPPSTASTAPVMNDARGERRKDIGSATSTGAPSRPRAVRVAMKSSASAESETSPRSIGVSVGPGQTQFTRMPEDASSWAAARDQWMSAALEAAYAAKSR
ncbi:zinc ribbon domain-containing protein [Frankia sp. Cpl3]|nr:zinc ribbon domain-containing protein [Frankia sp. Cpl3]